MYIFRDDTQILCSIFALVNAIVVEKKIIASIFFSLWFSNDKKEIAQTLDGGF